MKTIPPLALVIALAACSEKDEPTGRIYRYPVDTEAQGLEPMVRSGRGVRVDYHNHALPRPDDGQHWELQPGVFLRVDASGRVISTVPARYAGQ